MKKIFFLFITALLLGCSEEPDDEHHIEDNRWSIVFHETIINDSYPVYKTETFLFDRQQLIQHSVNQKALESEINYEASLTYSDHKVDVLTEGITLSYILNDKGYATRCMYSTASQKREYLFSYSAEDYLIQLNETIENKPYSITTFTYDDGDLTSVTSSLNGISNTIHYEPDENENYEYYIPCLGLLDTHPVTLHIEAVYAGLLGKSPRHLTAHTSPEGNDDEYTDYTYQFDDKGIPTHIKSQTFYQGKSFDTYYPNLRNISITIE
ncbi:DUF4595 domain-containing protein [Bacteroides sp. AN502(2024)]|uniref:DUF4595 domain-containing protein n=1 Tax=Bacteroides sp. AN502(2024) TaxID=3160599 RepID=UPI0035158588